MPEDMRENMKDVNSQMVIPWYHVDLSKGGRYNVQTCCNRLLFYIYLNSGPLWTINSCVSIKTQCLELMMVHPCESNTSTHINQDHLVRIHGGSSRVSDPVQKRQTDAAGIGNKSLCEMLLTIRPSCQADQAVQDLAKSARLIRNLLDLEQYFLLLSSVEKDKNFA